MSHVVPVHVDPMIPGIIFMLVKEDPLLLYSPGEQQVRSTLYFEATDPVSEDGK